MDSYAIVAGDKTIIRHAHLKKQGTQPFVNSNEIFRIL